MAPAPLPDGVIRVILPARSDSRNRHGGHGEVVITTGCGPVFMGSNPIGHPTKISAETAEIFV